MCLQFDPRAPSQCREDDAEDVNEKTRANFCEWFTPSPTAFDPEPKSEADQAMASLEAMFSGLRGDD